MTAGKIVSGSFDVLVGGQMAARKSDLMDHAGLIMTGCPTVVINGAAFLAARVTDQLECPQHGGGVIQPEGFPTVVIGGLPAARATDATLCLGGAANSGGGGGSGGGGASPKDPQTECEKLWAKYQKEAEDILAPANEDHRERNKIISAAYADLCLKNPEFQWAGLAAYASKQVGCAMDHSLKMRAIGAGGAAPGGVVGGVPGVGVAAGVSASANYTYQMLGLGNKSLFLDIYPMHRFYQEHGFEKLYHCAGERQPPIPAQALDGFRAIELYRKTGDKDQLFQSVRSLAWYEQVNVLQRDIYNDWTMRRILRVNETGLPGTLPADVVMGSGCKDPTGGKLTHIFGDKGRTQLYDIDERMNWILDEIAEDYKSFAGSKRHVTDLEVILRQGEMAGGSFP